MGGGRGRHYVLRETIIKNRPKLSPNSVKTYVSTLSSFYKKFNCKNIECLSKNVNEIIESLKDVTSNKRKTLLSALYILTNENDYKALMLSDCRIVNDNYKQQKATPDEKENWVTIDDIQQKVSNKLNHNNNVLQEKGELAVSPGGQILFGSDEKQKKYL